MILTWKLWNVLVIMIPVLHTIHSFFPHFFANSNNFFAQTSPRTIDKWSHSQFFCSVLCENILPFFFWTDWNCWRKIHCVMLCLIHAQVIDVKHASFSSNCQTYLVFDPSYINHRIMYGIYYTMKWCSISPSKIFWSSWTWNHVCILWKQAFFY